ncbi:ABC transporter permease [Actinocorallia longicatena]|uniref:ABC transmembrane type-1 domain-containing protein n=1 Tax=Actinocorallia longicatena TaxID=111803 RepID=A0ABP6QJ53_9ACTN
MRSRGPAGGVLLAALVLLAAAGPAAGGRDLDLGAFRSAPSWAHWFGTDGAGRDVFALTAEGLRRSLVIGLGAALLATGLAAGAGAFAGYLGGRCDRLLMAVADVLVVIPAVLLAAVLAASVGGRTPLLVVVLALFLWPVTARAVRARCRSLRAAEFVRAAECAGASPVRVVARHLLPNLVPLLVADATLNVGFAVLAESGLSYLGFGVREPGTSLGTLIAGGTASATVYPWLFLPAALLLSALILACTLLGDALQEAV